MIGATFWARYFPVFALGPVLVTLGVIFDNHTLIEWGTNFQKDSAWIFAGGDGHGRAHERDPDRRAPDDVPLAERCSGSSPRSARFLAFIVLLFGSNADFANNFNALNAQFGGGTTAGRHLGRRRRRHPTRTRVT